ncbi:MAG: sterol desaturase family protein [Sandaracinus sp.]|nr:sterol desaturase family protein [Sandaracinus sp.]
MTLALDLFLAWGSLAVLAVLVLLDFVAPARAFPAVRGWRLVGALSTALFFAVGTYAPFLWDELLASHRLVDLTSWPFVAQAFVGLLAYELVGYVWHRLLHAVPWLWRFHQMHHAAERFDVFGANYFHPVDMLGWAFATSLGLVWLVGLAPEAALFAANFAMILATFQHANLRTPRWLGYVIARPEMHAVHHRRGLHHGNFGDIALFDQLFGTWHNPEHFDAPVGLVDGGSLDPDLLLGRDLLAKDERAVASGRPSLNPT